MKNGSLVIIDDDAEDREIFGQIIETFSIPNPVVFFSNGVEALEYLKNTPEEQFLIICDINMPKLNGLQLRAEIAKDKVLDRRCKPYIYLTTGWNFESIKEDASMDVQGVFIKQHSYEGMTHLLKTIINYWSLSSATSKN